MLRRLTQATEEDPRVALAGATTYRSARTHDVEEAASRVNGIGPVNTRTALTRS